MEYDEEKYPEPPELKRMHVPPLLIQLKYMLIMFVTAFVISLAFAIIFKLSD